MFCDAIVGAHDSIQDVRLGAGFSRGEFQSGDVFGQAIAAETAAGKEIACHFGRRTGPAAVQVQRLERSIHITIADAVGNH